MAHHVLGIDLGAYSVKVIVLNPGFRQAQVMDFIERPVPAGDEPHEVRAARVVGQILRERRIDIEGAYAAAAGDSLFIHVLEFPFRNLRRQELEKAVGAELEGILPIDLEDMVFGFESLPADLGDEPAEDVVALGEPVQTGRVVGDDEPTEVRVPPLPLPVVHGRVAAPAEGLRVLACAMETGRARSLLDALGGNAVEPRGLVAAPASYTRVVERISRLHGSDAGASLSGATASGAPIAVIDIGHQRTDVCVVKDGRAVYARTLSRGGHHLTELISRAWRISYEQAQEAKHTDGFVGSPAEPATSEQWRRIHDVVIAEVGPLAADLKRTLASCRAKTGAAVGQVVLVGGGSRLRGLASFLADKLRIPVTTLATSDTQETLGPELAARGAHLDVASLAMGVALEGATGRPHFDLRQGELAYKADLSFLRQKAGTLLAALLVVMAFAVVNGYAAHYALRADEAALARRLALETTEVFGAQLSVAETLQRTQGHVAAKKSPLPKMTAYDVLMEINNHLPDRNSVSLEVHNLEIKSNRVSISATAQSTAEIDEIEEQLKKVDCFKVSRGDTSIDVDDRHQFSFSINSTCM